MAATVRSTTGIGRRGITASVDWIIKAQGKLPKRLDDDDDDQDDDSSGNPAIGIRSQTFNLERVCFVRVM